MFLKSLELMGFKSFGHKTIFEFQPGVTAIVGPNGSGKSNVCDAIRWVLGEQSARALRGTKMSEIIFAGTSQVRPAAYAQVKLLLDNESRKLPIDFSEVSIGRQLYRSGESNYIFNGNRSLLSDIREMLMDTGIGKDGYSVIGQGDIEDIIFQRAQSRRSLIEEAAGITKFKHRKTSTLTKLDATHGNITRLKDIINEIENQLGPLAEQAEQARRYQVLTNEIRALEIDLVLFDLSLLYAESENIDSMRRGLLGKIAEIQKVLEEIAQKKNAIRQQIQGIEDAVKNGQARVRGFAGEIEDLKQQSSVLKEEAGSHKARRQAITEEVTGIDELLERGTLEITNAESSLKDEETQEITVQGSMTDIEANILKAQGDLEAHLKEASQDKDSHFQMAVLMSDKRNRIQGANQQILMLQKQSEKSGYEIETLQSQKNKVEKDKTRLEHDIVNLEAEVVESNKILQNDKTQLNKVEKDLERSQEELNSVSDTIKIVQAKRNFLEELKNRGDGGMFRGVKEALALKDRELPGIFGMVGDLLTVPKGFETAFEVALGQSIQDIITRDAETAKRAIAILKERKAGRATFLPLDMIQAPSRLDSPRVPGCRGVALDLVEYDAKFYQVMNHLFGRILIFDTLDAAVAYSRTNRTFSRIVTLDGEVIRSSGAMTGGAEGQKGLGMLSRKRELEEIEERLTVAISKEKNLMSLVLKLKTERTGLYSSTRQREDGLARKKQSLDFFQKDLKKLSEEMAQKVAELTQNETDRKDVQAELQRQHQIIAEAQGDLDKFENQNRDLTRRLQALSGKEEAIQARINELKSLLTDERLKIATIGERKKAMKKEIDSAARRRREAGERKERALVEIERLSAAFETANTKVAELSIRIIEIENKKREAEAQLEGIQGEYRNASKEIESLDHASASRAKMEESTRNKLSELDIKLAEVKTNIQNKEGVLQGEYNFNMSEGNVAMRKYETRDELLSLVNDRRREREALEPVNLLAIDDYEKTRERYDFLNSQVNDLTEAAASLEQVIAEIEKISTERFIDTFQQIDASFFDIFQILFPGGNGHLKLSSPQEPLNSNVEIICQLPGKKLSTLELFSGGEKALIALALLFSILQVKPPAFCLLDEVEAALDEANVRRFTKLLRSFADKTQFLVITHNKETMQAVDVIYGVTLEKTGISRQISIRLEDQEKIKEFTVGKSR
jgi:chromosome segregation protein